MYLAVRGVTNTVERSAPHAGGLVTSPLPFGGSPTLHSGGQNQKGPTCGSIYYITLATRRVPNALEQGTESEMAQQWAEWLQHPCRLGVPITSNHKTKSELDHKWADWLHHRCHLEGP